MTVQAKRRFGEMLIEEDKIKEQDLQRALGEQKKYGQKLGQVLYRMGLISEEVIAEALGRQLGIPIAKLDECDLPGDVVGLIPKNIARNCNVIPIEKHYNWIRVAMTDPLDIAAMDQVAHFLRLEVLPSIATESEINRALERYYGMGTPLEDEEEIEAGQENEPETINRARNEETDVPPADSIETIVDKIGPLLSSAGEQLLPQEQHEEAPLTFPAHVTTDKATTIHRRVSDLISHALSVDATDIHIEDDADGGHVRMRVDGKLRLIDSFSSQARSPSGLVRIIKALAGLDEARTGPWEGRFDFSRDISIRVSTCLTVNGERAVLRIVDKQLSSVGLGGLGITSDGAERFKKALRQPGGLFLCSGPVGSGKTTTLYAAINHLNAVDKAVVSVEDLIEYAIDHVAQVEAGPRTGFSLPEVLSRALRQDPDVCAVGELRERETATLAVQAGLSGVTVLSTFCWNDAVGTLARLIELGMEPSFLASSVVCVTSQRLLRKICEGCKESYIPPQPILESIGVNENARLYRGKGCPLCRNTGYRGRTAVFELLFMDSDLRNLLCDGARRSHMEKAAAAAGMKTMREEAIQKALLGITTLEEALNRTKTASQTA